MAPKDRRIQVTVVDSRCSFYKNNDSFFLNGPLLDQGKSSNVCVTALNAIYPFIFALRKGVQPEDLGFQAPVTVQCPDYCAPVIFELQVMGVLEEECILSVGHEKLNGG